MSYISTVGFTIELDVFDCGICSVQCSLEGFGVSRDCEDSSTRCDDLVAGSGRPGMEDYDVYRDLMSWW